MPQLKSGRHVGIQPQSFVDQINNGTDVNVYAFILAYRFSVHKPADLRNFLMVVYFKEDQGTPPNAPAYHSGFLVRDVLDGKAGWSDEEIEEFRNWLDTNEALNALLTQDFNEINEAIQKSIIWTSEFITDEPEGGTKH